MDFLKYYNPPFRINDWCEIYVMDKNSGVTFNILSEDISKIRLILNIINGEQSTNNFKDAYHKNGVIYVDGEGCLLIRGWGRLIGTYSLTNEEACKAQDEFADWVVNKLKNN